MVVIIPNGSTKWSYILIVTPSNFGTLFVKDGNHPKPRLMALKPKLIEMIGILLNKRVTTKTERP